MITQYFEELPEGMTTPDFTRKPIALTIQEGKHIKREESTKVKANMIRGDSWELNDPGCEINKLGARTEDYHTDLLPLMSKLRSYTDLTYAVHEWFIKFAASPPCFSMWPRLYMHQGKEIK